MKRYLNIILLLIVISSCSKIDIIRPDNDATISFSYTLDNVEIDSDDEENFKVSEFISSHQPEDEYSITLSDNNMKDTVLFGKWSEHTKHIIQKGRYVVKMESTTKSGSCPSIMVVGSINVNSDKECILNAYRTSYLLIFPKDEFSRIDILDDDNCNTYIYNNDINNLFYFTFSDSNSIKMSAVNTSSNLKKDMIIIKSSRDIGKVYKTVRVGKYYIIHFNE